MGEAPSPLCREGVGATSNERGPYARVFDVGGADLGTFVTSEANWNPGRRIHRRADDPLEVVRTVAAEEGDDVQGYLVVAAVPKM
jgi:hypothetical protein